MGRARRTARQLRGHAHNEVYAAWRRRPVQPDTVLYESFSGSGMLCNPAAIFRHLLDHPSFSNLTHVWALRDPKRFRPTNWGNARVRFVKYGSPAYFRYLATAGYLINNATFPAEFGKRPSQTYLNTWHGTPLKKMGYGMPDGAYGARNILRNFLASDYLLSSSRFMTDQMYATDYRLRNIYRGKIVEEGLPRTDQQYGPGARKRSRRALQLEGLPVSGNKILLFAPTWRGDSFTDPLDQSEDLATTVAQLQATLPTGWVVLAKVHQAAHSHASRSSKLNGILVPNDVSTNLVLSAVDSLVTDYSSIFFDFLPLDRPITFYIPDREGYSATRGLYLAADGLPGETAEDIPSLRTAVTRAITPVPGKEDPYRGLRNVWASKFAHHDDGHVTERVVDVVFRGGKSQRLVDVSSDNRQKLLIYLGQLKPNGISNSALNLLSNIDYERFDVSCTYDTTDELDEIQTSIAAIDPRARQLPRVSGRNSSALSHARRLLMQRTEVGDGVEQPAEFPVARLYRDEWTRCFGDADFDYIVDFNGYGPFMDFVLLQGVAKSHSVWLHNDMYADARREVHGKRNLYRQLHSVFSTYRFFDNLVSVSAELCRVNTDQLAEYAPASSFTFAHNTINYERARRLATESGALPGGEAPRLPPAEAGEVTFITMGRLSTEKNHERLIRAFARIHSENPDTRLLILGSGPLRDHLQSVIDSLNMADCVNLTGFMANPYPVLKQSDCFVLSSDHEGQPMVILEALTLGIPVLITNFSSSRGALPPHTGMVVERSVQGLVNGMRSFLADRVPNPQFDPVAYNRRAMEEFYRAIGADGSTGGEG